MDDLSITQKTMDGNIELLKVAGNLDAHTFESFEDVLSRLIEQGRHGIIVDMSSVAYVSSAGVGVFIAAASEAQASGGGLVLLGLSQSVRDAFEDLGLTEMLETADDLEEALEQLKSE